MNEPLNRFIIPYNSIGYELRPSLSARGFIGKVGKAGMELMGLDIDTVKKEITVLTKKLTQKKNQLEYLEEQAARSSRTAIAYHAAKHFVKSVIGTKKSDAKQASSPERDDAEEAAIVGVDQQNQVPDKYDPNLETSKHKGKGGMPTPKSGHEKKGNWLQRMRGKPKGTPQHAEQTPGGHAHQSLARPNPSNFVKKVKGKLMVLSKFRKKKTPRVAGGNK